MRSARESDLELLGEYGRIALAFSGAQPVVLNEVRAANVVDDSYDTQPGSYTFNRSRPQPYQFLAQVASIAAAHAGALTKDVGFRFGAAPTEPAANPVTGGSTIVARYPGAAIGATYANGQYVISRDGRTLMTDGQPVTATNVVLQYVTIRGTALYDHNHNPTPYSVTTGTGQATLFRGGMRYPGTWARAAKTAPTTWLSAAGAPLTMAPGRTWVLLVPVGASISIS